MSTQIETATEKKAKKKKQKIDIFISMVKSSDIETDNETDRLAERQLSWFIVNKNSQKMNGDRRKIKNNR